LNGEGEDTLEKLDPDVAEHFGLKLFPAGTVLFAKSGMSATKGHVYRLRGAAYLVNHLAALTPHDPNDGPFLERALQRFSPTALIQDAAYPSVRLSDIERMKILAPLDPMDRRRIAEILDKADGLRAKRRAALAQLDGLTQSIFLDMFGDPATNPKGWPRVEFRSVCDRITVGIVVRPASYYVARGVPALRSLNVKPGKIILDDVVFFSQEDNDTKLTKTRLRAGDLVLVRSGQPGTAAVVPPHLHGVNAIDLLIASPSNGKCDPTFVCAFFNSSGGRRLVLASQRGQVQKHLNVGSLSGALIPVPPLELQREYSRRLSATARNVEHQTKALAVFDDLFETLQHRAFRGEL
jgi:type I restriction enzyme S subunit